MIDNIEIIQGDITKAKVDAIVNAANSRMLGGGGVDGAIHRAAGLDLVKACMLVPDNKGVRCPVGEARITIAGNLAARYVIHTVGPVYDDEAEPQFLLASAYRNSLRLALAHGCNSVALPAISCGVYGYPHQEAAEIALGVCSETEFASLKMSFYLFGEPMAQLWRAELSLLKAN